jgi:hypothetical protein
VKPTANLRLSRPQTARAVARSARTIEEFGLNLRDWFHELQRISTRAQLAAAVKVRPPSLAKKIPTGRIADAFLAAQVEFLCRRAGLRPPHWSRDSSYVLDEPWFSVPGRHSRAHLLLETPDEFRNRNVFTTSEVQVSIRPGRPRVSRSVKLAKARLRQQRYRQRMALLRARAG